MNYKFFDVETTGTTRTDEVCQIAVIVTDINLNVVDIVEEYCFPGVDFNLKAQEAHGLDREIVLKLSGGQTFEQIVEKHKLFREPTGAWVHYATNNFDPWICNNTLVSNGFKPINFGRKVQQVVDKHTPEGLYNIHLEACVRNSFMGGQVRKLLDVAHKASGKDYNTICRIYDKFLEKTGTEPKHTTRLHNALFDAFLMYMIVSCKRGVLPSVA